MGGQFSLPLEAQTMGVAEEGGFLNTLCPVPDVMQVQTDEGQALAKPPSVRKELTAKQHGY